MRTAIPYFALFLASFAPDRVVVWGASHSVRQAIDAFLPTDGDVAEEAVDDRATLTVRCASIPPALWCASETIAESCGVTAPCRSHREAVVGQPLHITLLYESLCPDCQHFIVDELGPFMASSLAEMVCVEMIPYGNAKRAENGTITCQHGPDECYINRYESCAIHFIHTPLPFISCLEEVLRKGGKIERAARFCYKKFHVIPHIYDQIVHCVNGPLGDQLQRAAAERTEGVWPDPHQHVPWLLFNNVSLSNQQFQARDVTAAVCQMYAAAPGQERCAGVGLWKRRKPSRSDETRFGCRRKN